MGVKKDKRPSLTAGQQTIVQALTPSGAASASTITTRIKQNGTTFITSTGTGSFHIYRIEQPRRAGIRKLISVKMQSTNDIKIQTHSSACSIDGTTANTVLFTTGAATRVLEIISKSTTAWTLVSKTTGMTFSKAATIA